jgi:phosphoserine phosphatase
VQSPSALRLDFFLAQSLLGNALAAHQEHLRLKEWRRIARCGWRAILSRSMNVFNPDTVSLTRTDFLDTVVGLAPRVAAFDCDGTLWSGDAGESFFDWEIRSGLVASDVGLAMRARYAEYKAGKVSEDDMCAEMVTMHAGISEEVMMQAASEFMEHSFPGRIFPEMLDLVQRLRASECDIWAVSSSNEWVIRAGVKAFDISERRILAAKADTRDGTVGNRILRVPSGPGKPKVLRENVKTGVDAAFGNSRWDTEMLAMARHAFAINPNPDLEATARERGWRVYFPDGTARR